MSTTTIGVSAPLQGVPRTRLHAVPGRGLPTRQRRPAMITAAVLLIVAGALGGLQVLTASNAKVSVLVLVQPVPAGHVIGASDLGSTALSGKVAYTPASAEASVVGATAARDLFAGQLVTHSMIATAAVPDVTHALVGLQLSAGQVPSAGLADGDFVELVDVPSATGVAALSASSPTSSSSVLATGTVYSIATSTGASGAALVTVLVPRAQAEALSVAASSSQVSLIRVGS
ncbi:MAG TPA: SAF domain-containing protein [Acidothermaceae bacterium]